MTRLAQGSMAKTIRKSSKRTDDTASENGDGVGRGIPGGGKSAGGRSGGGRGKFGRKPFEQGPMRSAEGKQLVIVESPSKAKTINKYLGSDYVVLASVGHVRDLPEKNPKGVKSPVPGVDLEHDFAPTYEVVAGKQKTITELKKAAKGAREIWFATDLDREGEAIAWHLADELGIDPKVAKRVIFSAITKDEIARAFQNPHPIDMDRVYAQQARRILDRVVGYQVSPLLWKKVARGLSAGRVQSVAVRLVVEREREIRNFIPEEYWQVLGQFALSPQEAAKLGPAWRAFLCERDEKGQGHSIKSQNAWLGEHGAIQGELVEVGGEKLDIRGGENAGAASDENLMKRARQVAEWAGLTDIKIDTREDERGRGPAKFVRTISGVVSPAAKYAITSIETKRSSVRPSAPFITSTLQQSASTRLGFVPRRTMQAAQALYEGVDIPGEGPVGLITYMRTDSTHISGAALNMAREYIKKTFGDKYLPEKPNFFSSSNKAAQEAHEAIRPTSLDYPPSRVKNALKPDHFRLYQLIWDRFVACQMTPAEWDSTTVLVAGGAPIAASESRPSKECVFRATGRTLAFDGFYRVTGVPSAAETATLPPLKEQQPLHPFAIDPMQKFTSPPARFSEASLIKALEAEGIGRPSTYASIIGTIQDRKYVESLDRRLFATDLGEVVTDKLVEAFPRIMDLGYTREMEAELDKVEEDHIDWVQMLHRFYGPFVQALDAAHETMTHAKAETTAAPADLRCPECGSSMVYRFGRNGRFLSCANYPTCTYACPVDREGRPRPAEHANIACHKCGAPMIRRTGRFGPFLGCSKFESKPKPRKTKGKKGKKGSAEPVVEVVAPVNPDACDGILNIDKKGHVVAPSPPALLTDLPCPKCGAAMNLRDGIRGPWLGCSAFPKCRGRGKWTDVPDEKRAALEAQLAAHTRAHPIPIIRTLDGKPLTDARGKPLPDAPKVEQMIEGGAGSVLTGGAAAEEREEAALESAA
ncbi:MAG: topoisomerase DNA-binding C4 zinc finger domain-containing protein [Phycisphaeraceae bacterium]|nr:topoisomerase DNA-binding C4 zinc finger domain-containing protein [Phycisphaeraceae bacterium]